jgi:hypothetical protein
MRKYQSKNIGVRNIWVTNKNRKETTSSFGNDAQDDICNFSQLKATTKKISIISRMEERNKNGMSFIK